MSAERTWDGVWCSVWLAVLTGVCAGLFPHSMTLQLLLVPLWVAYDLVTRGPKLGAWLALWGGLLLEGVWHVPPGSCASFFLLLWWVLTHFRESLPPMEVPAVYGCVLGVLLVPCLRFWLALYAIPFYGWSSAEFLPTVGGLFLGCVAGLLGGAALFTLADAMEFHVLKPKQEERLSDES